jgi:phage tail sheath protein FI
MPEYLTPGVYFELRDTATPVIRRVRTDIAGFVGLTERGPLNEPVQIDSWRQFQARFGNFVPYSFVAYAVKGFFENGGRTCFIVRIAGATAAKAAYTLRNNADRGALRISAMSEGIWGNKIAITLTQVRSDVLEFSLAVTWDRRERESFPNLSLKPDDKRYFLRIINEGDERTPPSQWIYVEDLLPLGIPRTAALLPDVKKSGLKNRSGRLKEGQDGIGSLTKNDFLGSLDPLATDKKGLSTFDQVDAVGIVCIPDIHIQPVITPQAPMAEEPLRDPCTPGGPAPSATTPKGPGELEQPPLFSKEDISGVQQAMIEHCERQKDRVAILDAPWNSKTEKFLTLAEIQDWRRRPQFDSERGYAAFYYPWIKVVDPLHIGGSPVRPIPPCGHIAGLYARSDFTVGVHKAPANAELFWAEDVTVEVNDEEQSLLNPEGINCLRAFSGRGIRVYGARTVSSNPDWRYVNVRRLLLMIEEAVDEATQWAVFEPHDFNLRQLLVLSVSSFLETLWIEGALVGTVKEDAFYVKCDETNNPPEVVDQGKLIVEVGVAPTYPAEFIVFRIGRTLEEFEVVER